MALRRRRPPSLVVSMTLDPSGDGSGDVTLRIGGFESVGDSHYLAHDDAVAGESMLSASRALGLLLRNWIDVIESVAPGHTRYVPFAFFDDGTGWLQLEGRNLNDVALRPGWSSLTGRSFQPSRFAAAEPRITSLSAETDVPELVLDRNLLVAQIVASIEGLPHHFPLR